MRRELLTGTPAPPDAQPYGVSATGAEHLVAEWVRHLGQDRVHVTQQASDGGYDVGSDEWVVQVKNYAGSVSVVELRELVGVATVDGRKPVLFTSGKLTREAEDFADKAGIAVFRYVAEDALLGPINQDAELVIELAKRAQKKAVGAATNFSCPDESERLTFWGRVFTWSQIDPGHVIWRGVTSHWSPPLEFTFSKKRKAERDQAWRDFLTQLQRVAAEDGIELPDGTDEGWRTWPDVLMSAAWDSDGRSPVGKLAGETDSQAWNRQLTYLVLLHNAEALATDVDSLDSAPDLDLSGELQSKLYETVSHQAVLDGTASAVDIERACQKFSVLVDEVVSSRGGDLAELRDKNSETAIALDKLPKLHAVDPTGLAPEAGFFDDPSRVRRLFLVVVGLLVFFLGGLDLIRLLAE